MMTLSPYDLSCWWDIKNIHTCTCGQHELQVSFSLSLVVGCSYQVVNGDLKVLSMPLYIGLNIAKPGLWMYLPTPSGLGCTLIFTMFYAVYNPYSTKKL